ncbi:MAG: serine/threonine protein kinase [Phycisphaerales bacterium]|nr:serine/threonine protein kinase [Phycisphaerales bacterium]
MIAAPRRTCPTARELEGVLRGLEPCAAMIAHVSGCPRCERRLANLHANLDLERTLAALSSTTGDVPTIDGYELRDRPRRGGQGIVYRATQVSTGRDVAVKVLASGRDATAAERARFRREIDVLARVEHPHLAPIFDGGFTADGRAYLVMRWIDGVSLAAWAEHCRASTTDGPMRRRAVLDVVLPLCDAVACVHRHGVIHRDLKPTNIIVDDAGRPWVIDFGLAMEVDRDRDDLARAGAFVGTLAYAAPEQVRHRCGAITTATDVYALGLILHELLSGRSAQAEASDLASRVESICTTTLDPPSRDGPRTADAELDTIVAHALAKAPGRRYPNADALASDLRRYRDGLPLDARRNDRWYVCRRTLARHRWAASGALAMVTVLVVAALGMTTLYRRAEAESARLREVNLFLEDTIGSVSAASGAEPTLRDTLDEASHWIDLVLGERPEVAFSIRMTVANGYRNLGDLAAARGHLDAAATLVARCADPDAARARVVGLEALVSRDAGSLDDAARRLREGLAIRERRFGTESREAALTRATLGDVLRRAGDLDGARDLVYDALAIRRAVLGADHPDVAMAMFSLGEIERDAGRMDAAAAWHAAALRIRAAILAPGHPDLHRSREALGASRIDVRGR